MKYILAFFLLIPGLIFSGPHKDLLKAYRSVRLSVNEPSEICLSSDKRSFIILANKAKLYQIDSLGNILNKSSYVAYDIEGASILDNKIYVSEESLRQVLIYDESNLKLLKKIQLQYNGPRNTAFESITHDPTTDHFFLATEKNPQNFFEYDKQFVNVDQFSIPGITEVSGMTWHNNELWVLSDEQETVFRVDPSTHAILNSWSLPIINPEGLCFDAANNLVVISDDMGKIFFFKDPMK